MLPHCREGRGGQDAVPKGFLVTDCLESLASATAVVDLRGAASVQLNERFFLQGRPQRSTSGLPQEKS